MATPDTISVELDLERFVCEAIRAQRNSWMHTKEPKTQKKDATVAVASPIQAAFGLSAQSISAPAIFVA
jgi:hypothetical protein